MEGMAWMFTYFTLITLIGYCCAQVYDEVPGNNVQAFENGGVTFRWRTKDESTDIRWTFHGLDGTVPPITVLDYFHGSGFNPPNVKYENRSQYLESSDRRSAILYIGDVTAADFGVYRVRPRIGGSLAASDDALFNQFTSSGNLPGLVETNCNLTINSFRLATVKSGTIDIKDLSGDPYDVLLTLLDTPPATITITLPPSESCQCEKTLSCSCKSTTKDPVDKDVITISIDFSSGDNTFTPVDVSLTVEETTTTNGPQTTTETTTETTNVPGSTSTSNPGTTNSTEDDDLSPGAIVGIVVGCVAAIVIIIIIIVCCRKKKKEKHPPRCITQQPSNDTSTMPQYGRTRGIPPEQVNTFTSPDPCCRLPQPNATLIPVVYNVKDKSQNINVNPQRMGYDNPTFNGRMEPPPDYDERLHYVTGPQHVSSVHVR